MDLQRGLKELFGTSTQPVEYPTHIGLNGNNLDESMVEKECGDLIELFRFCRCVRVVQSNTLYGYYFSVILPENISNEGNFKELLQRVAESSCRAYATVWNSRQ